MAKLILVGFLLVVIAITLVCVIGIRPKKKPPTPKPIVEDQEGMQSKQLDIEDAKVFFLTKEEVKKEHPWQKELDAELAARFRNYAMSNKLRYCGKLNYLLCPSPTEIDSLLKELESQPDLQVFDFYSYKYIEHFIAIWTGEKWWCGKIKDIIDYNPHSTLEIQVKAKLVSSIKLSPDLLAYSERLENAASTGEFIDILDEGNSFFTTELSVEEYPFNRWTHFREQAIAASIDRLNEYTKNLAKASNKQVYDIALSVADESSDSGFVSVIRREFSDRLKILKELDLARQYEMDQQEQVKQELDSAARFFN